MKYRITHTTKYSYASNASLCQNKVHLAPRPSAKQRLLDFRLVISPDTQTNTNCIDAFGNRVDYFAISTPHHGLSVTAISRVELLSASKEIENTPSWEEIREYLRGVHGPVPDGCQFTFASKFVPLNNELKLYASQSFLPDRPTLESTLDLTKRIHQDFKYDSKATTVSTPVMDVFRNRAGVCQDFAHLQIACMRSLGLAARYVSGYLRTAPPPGKARQRGCDESHAWLSVFCGTDHGWVDIDPTNNVIPQLNHTTVAWGRDYADVCPIQGVVTGGGNSQMSVSVDVDLDE